MDGSGWRPGGGLWGLPAPLERQELGPPGGAPFLWRNGGEHQGAVPWTPWGKEFLSPTPLSLTVVEAAWVFCRPTWPAASKTNASRPAHQLGRREKWFVDGRRKRKPNGSSLPSPKGYYHVPSPPSRWAGRYGPFQCEGRRPGNQREVQLPPHNPTRRGSPEGRTSSLWGSFPHFFPRNGAPAGQAPVPARSNGVGKPPQKNAAQRGPTPTRQARPQKASRIWYHTAPPCTEADTPSLTNPNLA